MPTLTVDENTYIDLSDANDYFDGHVNYADWAAADDDTKSRALITAARMMQRESWVGEITDTAQDLKWPRSGVSDTEGTPILDTVVPPDIINGQCELALALIQNDALQTLGSTANDKKRVQAGPVSVEFFKTSSGQSTKYPLPVQQLFAAYLASTAGSGGGSVAYGDDYESQFDECDEFNLNGGT